MKEPDAKPHLSEAALAAIERHIEAIRLLAVNVAFEMDGTFLVRDVVVEGEVSVTAQVRARGSGTLLGSAELLVPLPVAEHLQGPTDTDTLEVSPGAGLRRNGVVVG